MAACVYRPHFAYLLFQLWAPRLPPTYHTAKTTMNTMRHVHMSMDENFIQIPDCRMNFLNLSEECFLRMVAHSTLPPAMQNVTIFIALLNFGIFQLSYFCWFTRCKMVSHHFLKLNFSIFCISSSLINCQLIPFAHFSLGMVVF